MNSNEKTSPGEIKKKKLRLRLKAILFWFLIICIIIIGLFIIFNYLNINSELRKIITSIFFGIISSILSVVIWNVIYDNHKLKIQENSIKETFGQELERIFSDSSKNHFKKFSESYLLNIIKAFLVTAHNKEKVHFFNGLEDTLERFFNNEKNLIHSKGVAKNSSEIIKIDYCDKFVTDNIHNGLQEIKTYYRTDCQLKEEYQSCENCPRNGFYLVRKKVKIEERYNLPQILTFECACFDPEENRGDDSQYIKSNRNKHEVAWCFLGGNFRHLQKGDFDIQNIAIQKTPGGKWHELKLNHKSLSEDKQRIRIEYAIPDWQEKMCVSLKYVLYVRQNSVGGMLSAGPNLLTYKPKYKVTLGEGIKTDHIHCSSHSIIDMEKVDVNNDPNKVSVVITNWAFSCDSIYFTWNENKQNNLAHQNTPKLDCSLEQV